MKLIEGRIDYSGEWREDLILLFTGNPVIKKNGAIVMGRGAARQVRDNFPGVDKQFGDLIKQDSQSHIHLLNLADEESDKYQYLGWFKVKHHWQENADVNLIQTSAEQLAELAQEYDDCTFYLNMPGTGNGNLDRDDVLPLLEILPDNVYVVE